MSRVHDIALAFVQEVKDLPAKQYAEACDAAIPFLVREGINLSQFTREVKRLWKVHAPSVIATVATPEGDIGPAAKNIETILQKHLGKTVEVENTADASLIGGAVVSLHDERIDRSLRGALERARETLLEPVSLS